MLSGPPDRVAAGAYRQNIDHLSVLATVLDLYGALSEFRRDFGAVHTSDEGRRAAANLLPLTQVFPALPARSPRP